MAHETRRLAEYASTLRFADLPESERRRAKDLICDSVATMAFGSTLPWSRMIAGYAARTSAGGRSRVLAPDGPGLSAGPAALVNGAAAHAFEMDSLTRPSSGVHPGAVLVASGLAVAQEQGRSGADLITALIAGLEVVIRIGRATRHTNEKRGFHAPGTTGPFGAAVTAAHLSGLDAAATTHALGIAGSTSAGLLEFARSGTGAMVKRLHLGRAAESGVLAAALAADGFTGPESVIEGEFGFLAVYCTETDPAALTKGLGRTWAGESVLIKRFAAHITAHTPVQAMLELQAEHGFAGADVESITVAGNDRMVLVNNAVHPVDTMMAQYSVPFCVALAAYRDLLDPRAFDGAIEDAAVAALAERVNLVLVPGRDHADLTADVSVTLRDGRTVSATVDTFPGTPQQPLDTDGLRDRFLRLTRDVDEWALTKIFERLQALEEQPDLDWLAL